MTPSSGAKTFAGKFLEKLDKISHDQIEAFLSRLQNEKSFFEGILEHLLEGVVVTDPDGRTLYINPTARAMLGLGKRRRIVGAPLLGLPLDDELYNLLRDYTPGRDQILTSEIEIGRPDARHFSVTLLPIEDEDDRLVSIVTILRDLTERKREEERRLQAERMSSLAALTSGVAHEIKNPLNNLKIHAWSIEKSMDRIEAEDGARDDEARERARQSAEVLKEEVNRLTRIVEEFLNTDKPGQPRFQIGNVNEVLRHLAGLMGSEVAERGVQVEMELDSSIPNTRIDGMRLSLAFRNVLKNSLEAVNKETGWIVILTHNTDDGIEIEFRDNGPGIPNGQLKRVFEPYITNKPHGTGLGLMMVKRIVNEHRGRVDIQSEPGEGTTLTIWLPPGHRPRRMLPDMTARKD